jgi:hypothetical protein
VTFTARRVAGQPGCAALNYTRAFQGQGEGPSAKRPCQCAAASFEKPGKGATEIHHQPVKMTAAPWIVSPTSSRLSRTPPCLSILISGQKHFDRAPGNMLAL